jgi:hypothetical protein
MDFHNTIVTEFPKLSTKGTLSVTDAIGPTVTLQ